MKEKLLLSFLISAVAWGQSIQVYNVPPFSENGASESVSKIDVPKATVVQMDPFSATVPSGWSFLAAGVSEKWNGSLTITPSSDIEHDETYVGLMEKKGTPGKPVSQRLEALKAEHKDWKSEIRQINGNPALVAWYTRDDSKSHKKLTQWAAHVVAGGKEFLFVSATPADKADRYKPVIEGIFDSVRFRGSDGQYVNAPSTDGGMKTVSDAPPIDPRLKDKWVVTSYKMDDDSGFWTEGDAKQLMGKSVTFDEKQITIGETPCQGITQVFSDEEEQQHLLSDAGQPCENEKTVSPVFSLKRKSCRKKTNFPPYLALGDKGSVIAFGDSISFCLKRPDKK